VRESHPYLHDEVTNNTRDPERMLPAIYERIRPRSVVDLGCGIGTFLGVSASLGVEVVQGLDGDWVDRDLLAKNMPLSRFRVADLSRPLPPPVARADLALCLEVAEHLPAESAEMLVRNIVATSDVVLFSAAIPGQGGQHHVNEQWPGYWAELFRAEGYCLHDVIRPMIWDEEEISWWYRQNTFLVVSESSSNLVDRFPQAWRAKHEEPLRLVHPDLFADRAQAYKNHRDDIFAGRLRSRAYFYLLAKSLFGTDRRRR